MQVVQRGPDDGIAHYMLCVAFTRIGAEDKKNGWALSQAKREGQESVRLLPEKGEPHFWLAEAQRLSGDWAHAGEEYREYLRLSNFDGRLAGNLDYWILGLTIGIGKKTRPSQQDIWKDFRNLAYFGLCDWSFVFCPQAATPLPTVPMFKQQVGFLLSGI